MFKLQQYPWSTLASQLRKFVEGNQQTKISGRILEEVGRDAWFALNNQLHKQIKDFDSV